MKHAQVYNEMYHLYNLEMLHEIQPAVVLTEDSNAGFECFCMIYGGICQSAVGKSNVYNIKPVKTNEYYELYWRGDKLIAKFMGS